MASRSEISSALDPYYRAEECGGCSRIILPCTWQAGRHSGTPTSSFDRRRRRRPSVGKPHASTVVCRIRGEIRLRVALYFTIPSTFILHCLPC